MELQKDFAELCSLFNAKRIKFLIVGGYAVAFHGAPRFTGDLDILIRPDIEQVGHMLEALHEFGFPARQIVAAEMLQDQSILQLGRVPVQVHLLTNLTGVPWDDAWSSRRHPLAPDSPGPTSRNCQVLRVFGNRVRPRSGVRFRLDHMRRSQRSSHE
jgi:hypothetical protein